MTITRREFVQRAGLAVGSGLIAPIARTLPPPSGTAGATLGPIPGVPCDDSHEFKNWAETIEFRPARFCEPRSEAEVVAIVKDAVANGTKVRVQGAGHSFNHLVVTDHTLVTLDDVRGTIWQAGNRVTVPAGIRLKELIKELRYRQLGMRNLGSITEQSIAGAFSTGTHGSGLKLGAISTQVVGVQLVDGNADIREITESDTDDLAAARINIGALGIITRVTLDCVPLYDLEYTAYLTTFKEVVANIDQLARENMRLVVWWFLVSSKHRRDACIVITKNPPGHPVSDVLKHATDGTKLLNRILPKDMTVLLSLLGKVPATGFKKVRQETARYDKVLTIPLVGYHHRECEYAIPEHNTVKALEMMRQIVEEGDLKLELPVEVRYVAKDEAFLSPAYKGPVCYIGASTMKNSTEVFERFEPLMKALGGRPHWGKNATITRDEVQAMYPDTYDCFRHVRNKYDPKRVFANSLVADLYP